MGWITADKLAATSWKERVQALNRHGYAGYDERTASMLGDACELLLDRYRGDLRRLHAEAGQNPKRERQLLKVVKGLDEVGVDIFFPEAQVAWEELFPLVDGGPPRPPAGSAWTPTQGAGRWPEPRGVRAAGGRAGPHRAGRRPRRGVGGGPGQVAHLTTFVHVRRAPWRSADHAKAFHAAVPGRPGRGWQQPWPRPGGPRGFPAAVGCGDSR